MVSSRLILSEFGDESRAITGGALPVLVMVKLSLFDNVSFVIDSFDAQAVDPLLKNDTSKFPGSCTGPRK